MSHTISSESCSACGACSELCPTGAITYQADACCYVIDAKRCIDCAACKDACGSGAARAA